MTASPAAPPTGTVLRIVDSPSRRVALRLSGLARLVLRVRDLRASLRFFGEVLGLPVVFRGSRTYVRAGASELELREQPGMAICGADSTDVFTLRCAGPDELRRAAGILAAARVPNTGVWENGAGNEVVRFTDPDGRVFELEG